MTPGTLTLPRANAHRLVIVAAALTVAVAAALATALAAFSSQALPRAVRHDLSHAAGTSMVITGNVDNSQGAQYTSLLPGQLSTALDGTPFGFYHAYWSDPLGFVPGSRPVPPGGTHTTQIAEAAALDDIAAHATLVSGHWPGALPGNGAPIPAALPASAAALLHVTTGDVLQLHDRISGHQVRFVVTGLYRPQQVSAMYWGLDDVALGGQSTLSGFTTYGPLAVPAAAFSGPLAVDAGSWLAVPQTASVPSGQLRAVAANVTGLRQALAQAVQLPDLTMTTGLPAVLDGTASNRDVARSLLDICTVLLGLLAAAALLAVARLLTGQREGESAMLVARGATRWQLIRLAAAEAVPLCLLCAAVGGVAGVGLADLLAGPVSVGWPAVLAAVAVGVIALVILLVPVLSTVTPGTARARRGRQAAVAGVTRAGADLALIVLAVVAGYQLRHYSAVSAGASGNFGVDPVVVVAPALALAGGTVLALRLLPAGGKAGDLLAARGRRLTAAMASWQISRQPIRQGGAALLIVLAVATGTLALSQRQSWTQSVHDQAAFSAGSDVRVESSQPLTVGQAGTLATSPGVRRVMPVASFTHTDTNAVTLAIDAAQAAQVVRLRSDESPLPAGQLFGKIEPSGPPSGVTLPGRGSAFRLTARLGPATLRLGSAQVTVSVEDADNAVYQFDAGSLPADGQDHVLTVDLGSAPGSPAAAAIYPLRLSMINLVYTLPAKKPGGAAVFTLDGVAGVSGQVAGTALRGWPAQATSTELLGARQIAGTVGPSAAPSVSGPSGGAGNALTVTFQPGYGLAASGFGGGPPSTVDGQLTLTPNAGGVIPGVATQRFLGLSNARVGSTVQTNLDGAIVLVKIVAAVSTFPTVTGSGGGLIVDLGTLQAVLARGQLQPAPVTQWWLTASGTPRLTLPPGSAVTSSAGIAAGLLADPLSTVPQQALLAVAIAAAVLAITGFCVSIAAGVRQRRAENALLAALGVPPRSAAAQLSLEKLMLSVPSAVAGLILGAVLAELLVPAITLTPAATQPVPPVLIQLAWFQILTLALAVSVLPVIAAGLTIARRPDPAAELRAAESA
ncbi:MAG: ABC transporter permease [Streptosporangiaceae bacterium]